jgi:phage-related protein
LKPLRFVGSTQHDLRRFPDEARQHAGYELDQIQRGRMPSDFRPLLNVGPGAYEIRIHARGEWRVVYVAKFADAIYVLHAFQKKTQKTSKEDIELAACRYRQITE